MRRIKERLGLVASIVLLLNVYCWDNGQDATHVIGQADLVTGTTGTAINKMYGPMDVALDEANGKLYVVDGHNNRVLRFAYPITSNNPDAELVFGQPDFDTLTPATSRNGMHGPRGVAVDKTGRLWVGEYDNSRVIWFNQAYAITSNQPNADGVLGQPDFTTSSKGVTQSKIGSCYDIAVTDNGTVYVADAYSHRVLRYDDAANKANGANADGVLGQVDFTSSTAATTQSRFNSPRGLALYHNTLFVGDRTNARVLRFDDVDSKANGANADGVLGQTGFSSFTRGCTQALLEYGGRLHVDGDGRLYVADGFNNDRILIWNDAINRSDGDPADAVIGQENFTDSGSGLAADRLDLDSSAGGMVVDPTRNILIVPDTYAGRVLLFDDPITGPELNVRTGSTYVPAGATDARGGTVQNSTLEYILENAGDQVLSSVSATVFGADSSHFVITSSPTATVAAAGTTTVQITFSSSDYSTKTATLRITSNDASENPYDIVITANRANVVPVAIAEADAALVNNTVTMSGSQSYDPNDAPSPLTFSWAYVSGPVASPGPTLTDETGDSMEVSFTPTVTGDYTFELTVDDGADTATDQVTVTVTTDWNNVVTPDTPKSADDDKPFYEEGCSVGLGSTHLPAIAILLGLLVFLRMRTLRRVASVSLIFLAIGLSAQETVEPKKAAEPEKAAPAESVAAKSGNRLDVSLAYGRDFYSVPTHEAVVTLGGDSFGRSDKSFKGDSLGLGLQFGTKIDCIGKNERFLFRTRISEGDTTTSFATTSELGMVPIDTASGSGGTSSGPGVTKHAIYRVRLQSWSQDCLLVSDLREGPVDFGLAWGLSVFRNQFDNRTQVTDGISGPTQIDDEQKATYYGGLAECFGTVDLAKGLSLTASGGFGLYYAIARVEADQSINGSPYSVRMEDDEFCYRLTARLGLSYQIRSLTCVIGAESSYLSYQPYADYPSTFSAPPARVDKDDLLVNRISVGLVWAF